MQRLDYIEREKVDGGGVYAFFVFDSMDSKGYGVYKIGMTQSFHKRIGGYHTYLPGGLYYKCLLINPTLKRTQQNLASYYVKIEREIFNDIKQNGGKVISMKVRKRDEGNTEWIYASEKMISDAFDRADLKYSGKRSKYHIIENLKKELKPKLAELKQNAIFKGEIFFT